MVNFHFSKHGDKLFFLLALAILAAALLQTGIKTGIRKKQNAAPGIVFTQWWQDDLENDSLEDLIKEFESLHKGIKITLEQRSYEEIKNGLFNSGDAAIPGDLIALDPLWFPELLKRGIIESPKTESQNADQYAAAPLLSFINVLFYDIDILKEAGFSGPPKSRGEFLNCARALSDGEGKRLSAVLGMGGASSRWIYDEILPWIWAGGAQLVKDGKPLVNSRPVIETLAFLTSLNQEGYITPGAFAADSGKKLDDFISGRSAFIIAPAAEIRRVRERMGDGAFGVTSVPSPDNFAGKTFFASAAWALGINPASGRREEAGLFADFITEKAPQISERAAAVPGMGILSATDPFHSKVWDIAIAGEAAQDFSGLPWTEMESIFREELSALFAEKSSPAEAAAAIQRRWETVLDAW